MLSYLLKLSRPRFWLYLAGPVLVATAFAITAPSDLLQPRLLALFAYALLPANILLYGVNDRFDAEVDARNPKKDDKEARFEGGGAVWASIGLSGLLGILLLFWLPPVSRPFLLGFFFLAVFYSAPPLRFKARFLWDSLSNGLYILPGVAAYALLSGSAPPTYAILGGWLWTMAMHTFSAIPDIEPDREAGIETTAIRLGEGGAYAYCFVCWLLAMLSFGQVGAMDGELFSPLLWFFLPYPLLVAFIAIRRVDIHRAYWWFPLINAVLGMALTLLGLLKSLPRWDLWLQP
jgi:4-hydroxybenzoate polyprenyltransferase